MERVWSEYWSLFQIFLHPKPKQTLEYLAMKNRGHSNKNNKNNAFITLCKADLRLNTHTHKKKRKRELEKQQKRILKPHKLRVNCQLVM